MGLPVRLRCLRNDIARADARFASRAAAVWHAADLTGEEDELWSRLTGSARNIRCEVQMAWSGGKAELARCGDFLRSPLRGAETNTGCCAAYSSSEFRSGLSAGRSIVTLLAEQ
jgi:hypothetical protein